jgi:hypothetical protein
MLKLIAIAMSRMEMNLETWGCRWREFSPLEVVQLLVKVTAGESRFWKIGMAW